MEPEDFLVRGPSAVTMLSDQGVNFMKKYDVFGRRGTASSATKLLRSVPRPKAHRFFCPLGTQIVIGDILRHSLNEAQKRVVVLRLELPENYTLVRQHFGIRVLDQFSRHFRERSENSRQTR